MAQCKEDVTTLLMPWSAHFLVLLSRKKKKKKKMGVEDMIITTFL